MSDLFRRYVLHNFWLKVFSLLAASALWYAVAREPTAEIAFTVPIEFQHVPDNMEIASERVPDAQIRIRGPQRLIREVAASQIHPVIDLSRSKPGERTYDLRHSEISVPQGVEVVQVVPTQFLMELDRRATRMVMQVHDELVLEVPEAELDWARAEVPRLMAGVAALKVPLLAEVGVGANWDQAH